MLPQWSDEVVRTRQARRGKRSLPLLGVVAAVLLIGSAWQLLAPDGRLQEDFSDLAVPATPSATAFVGEAAPVRSLLSKRVEVDGSLIAMSGGSRRQNRYNMPKKMHIRNQDHIDRVNVMMTPIWLTKLTHKKDASVDEWSQTLVVTFPEGEDDVVTEEEMIKHFTTDEFKAVGAIVGHKIKSMRQKRAYVHFDTNEETKIARYAMDGKPVGGASETRVRYVHDRKWIRLRDGVGVGPHGLRADWMKPYGNQAYIEGTEQGFQLPTGTRTHPVYPE